MSMNTEKKVYTLRIDKGFKELIRPLFKNEYLQLEANLIADGCREPIAVWNGVIVDGHNRYKICSEHSISLRHRCFHRLERILRLVRNVGSPYQTHECFDQWSLSTMK